MKNKKQNARPVFPCNVIEFLHGNVIFHTLVVGSLYMYLRGLGVFRIFCTHNNNAMTAIALNLKINTNKIHFLKCMPNSHQLCLSLFNTKSVKIPFYNILLMKMSTGQLKNSN